MAEPPSPGIEAEGDPGSSLLRAILANLGREIDRPLSSLRGEIGQFLLDRAGEITEPERNQAGTMLALCDDLARLTQECLGIPGPSLGGGCEPGPRWRRHPDGPGVSG